MARKSIVLAIILVVLCIIPSYAGSIYGIDGIIETPSDQCAVKYGAQLTGTYISEFADTSYNLTMFGVDAGLGGGGEISWVNLDSDAPKSSSHGILSAKFAVSDESFEKPGIAVGVVDINGELSKFASGSDKSSAFVVFGKTLTTIADRFTGRASKPVRGTFGFGTGIYKGVFGSLSFYTNPQFKAQIEFLSKGIREKSTVNAALQMNVTDTISLKAGAIGLKDFFGCINFSISK